MEQPEGGSVPLPHIEPGQQPTPEQVAQIQLHVKQESERLGITVEEYVERLKAQAMAQQQEMMRQQQAQAGQQQPIQPGPPKPEAIALANWLRTQDLKPRTCIFQEKRKDMFKVKRAIRALHSDEYKKARAKNPLLPEVNDRVTAENTFKLLPMSLLALRVSKIDPDEGHEGHSHGQKKRVKGLWTVKIEQQQEAQDDMYYVWFYEGSQWKQKAYSLGAIAVVFTLVLFPLWPLFMRQGVWYLSMGMLGLIGLFFVMAIFRLILFVITMFTHAPGLWLFPNLFEDVGFFDSFKPVWAWNVDKKAEKKAKREAKAAKAAKKAEKSGHSHAVQSSGATATTSAEPAASSAGSAVRQRPMQAMVEEADDE